MEEPMIPGDNGPATASLPLPEGDYRESFGRSALEAGLALALTVLVVVAAIAGIPSGSVLEDWLMRIGTGLVVVFFPIAAVKALLRPWREPRFRIDREGIHMTLRRPWNAFLPFVRARVESIPWSKILRIEAGPLPIPSVVIDYEGYERPDWLERIGLLRADIDGRVLDLSGLTVPGASLRRGLVDWYRERR
jgi:hypothetical protein